MDRVKGLRGVVVQRVVLTGRQRDFLASYPDEVSVSLSMGDGNDVVVEVVEVDELGVDEWVVVVPPGGFIDQPTVSLDDWESGLELLYEDLNAPCEAQDDDKVGDMR